MASKLRWLKVKVCIVSALVRLINSAGCLSFAGSFPVSSVPLHRRIFRSRRGIVAPGPAEQAHEYEPRVHRKVWNKGEGEKQMELALCDGDVATGVLPVRKAALIYGIPKSTLHVHVSGKVRPGAGVGLPKYLTDEEEDELVRWLEGCAKRVRETRAVVGAIVAKKQRVECAVVSHGWWDRFRKRHPHLTLRAGEALAYRRAIATSPETFRSYFDQLEDILNTNGLRHAPSRIFNADESGIPLQHRPGKRIAVRGQKHVMSPHLETRRRSRCLLALVPVDATFHLW